jgi:hypothetical protein
MKLFDKYRLNQANEEEVSAMTEKLINNKFDQERRKAYADKLTKEYGISRSSSANTFRMTTTRWIIGVAAVLLVGVVSWQLLISTGSYTTLTNEYLAIHYPNNETRKGATNLSELRAAAITAYNNKDYQQAAELRSQVVEQAEANEYDFFFLGLSYLYQQPAQTELAIRAFQQAINYPAKELLQESEWYLSLAYLKANQLDQARTLLQKRVKDNRWNAEKAARLLKALDQEK